MTTWHPVNPALDEHDVIVSLRSAFPTGDLTVVRPAAGERPFTDFEIRFDSLSMRLAAKLNLGPIFSGELSVKDRAYLFEAMAYSDAYREEPDSPGLVRATRWGAGLRIALRITEVKASAESQFGLVAAQAELGMVRASYQIQGIGLGLGGLSAILGELKTIGDFTYETYLEVQRVSASLQQYIADHASDLQPRPIGVLLAQPIVVDTATEGYVVYWTVTRIRENWTLASALAGARQKAFSDALVEAVWREFLEDIPAGEAPSRWRAGEGKRKAEEWLRV